MSRVVGLTAAAADSVAHIEVALVWSEDMARQGQCSRVFCGVPVYLNAIASLDTYCPLRAHLSLGAVHVRPLRVQCCCSQSSAASVNRADFSSCARARPVAKCGRPGSAASYCTEQPEQAQLHLREMRMPACFAGRRLRACWTSDECLRRNAGSLHRLRVGLVRQYDRQAHGICAGG